MNTDNDPSPQTTTATSSDPAWFKTLVDNSPNGVYALNDRQEIIFVNAKMSDILGYPQDEILGCNFQIFLTEESVAFVTEQYQKRQRGEEVPTTYEFRIRCKNGEKKLVEVSGGVIHDEAGRPVTIGTMVDQSWRKEATDRLRRYEQIISTSEDLLAFVDKNYIYQAVNRAYLRFWNKEEESEIVGHSAAELLGEEVFQTTVKEKLDRCLAGESIHYTRWFDFASARQGFADLSYHPCSDEQGKIVGVIAISRDITKQELARQALVQQKKRAQAYLDIAGVMLGALDLQGTITLMNKKGHELLGYTEGELLGKNWFATCLPATNREEIAAIFQQQMSGDVTPLKVFENSVLTRAGDERLVAFHNTLLYDGDKLCGVLFSGEDITERKRIEKELQKSEERLDLAMMVKNEGIWDWNLGTNQVDFDQRYYTMAGYDPDDFANNLEEFQKRVHPEDVDCVMATAEQYLAGEIDQFQVEFRFKHKDGSWVWIQGRGQIVERDEKGMPLRFIGTHIDITDRKAAESAVRKAAEDFRLLADHTYDWEYWLSPERTYRYVSPACERITGYSPDEFIAHPQLILDIVDPDYADQVERHYRCENTGSNGFSLLVFPIWTKTGEQRWIEHHCAPVFDDQGVYAGRRGNNRDITDRKQLEQQQAKLLAAIHQTEENIVITDTAGLIEYVNPAFEALTGYTKDEVLGKNPRFLQNGETDSALYRELWGRLTSGQSWQGRFVNKKKDGTRYIEEVSISPVIDPQGRTTHYVAVKKDISNQLEQEQQLRQKYKMEAVGTMAGGIAHNFNNNLSVILGNVELSQLKNNNPEVDQLLKNAKIGVMRSRDLVSQIMSYSRKGAQSLAPLKLPLIIDETLKLLSATIPTTVQLTQTISPDSYQATINADASQIQEILLNLYGNAVHAMEEKGTLAITLDVVDLTNKDLPHPGQQHPGRYARITIQDSGCGMTAEVQEKIFDPFFTTKEMYEGTGMGLATVQAIIEQHKGLIQVESSVGQGTTFELYFPLIDQPQAAQPTPVKADIPRGAEKILFVDDDEMPAKLGELMLTELGYQVSLMTESPEALKLFAANADYFDLVITDQTMPDLSGKELIQELLKIRPDIPTIICTGYSSQVSEKETAKFGAKAFVMKPLNLQELGQTVRRVLDGGKEE